MNSKEKLALVVAILASSVAFLDGSVVNVALPAISEEFGGGITLKQWVVDAYLITLGSFILIAGSLSDLFGRRRILILGLWGFALTSILCALAPSGIILIVARALQGVAGALLVPSSLALIIAVFSSAKQGKAIGAWTAWTGVAFIVGPVLGGILVDVASWRWIFAINVIPIATTLWLLKKLEFTENIRSRAKIDIKGAALGAVGLAGPVFALIEQPNYGWGSPLIYGSLVLGILALIWFFVHENKSSAPMMPLSLFNAKNFLYGNLATISIYGGLSVITFLIAVFVQQVGEYAALQAGLTLLPVTIIMFILSPRFGALSDKYGPRLFMTAGPILSALGILSLVLVNEDVNFWIHLLPGLLVFSVGLAATVAPLTSAVLGAVDKKSAGIGSAVNNAVARIAGLVAIACLAFIVGPEVDLTGFEKGIIFTSLLLAVGGIISWFGIKNIPRIDSKVTQESH